MVRTTLRPVSLRRAPAAFATAFLLALVAAIAGGATPAQAGPLCTFGSGSPEYQTRLGALLSPPSPVPPPPPPPPVSRSATSATSATYPAVGARTVAREAVGAQYTMLWLNSTLQGWVVGVAPGPLDLQQARARIVEALVPHFTPADLAYLDERLYVDPQPYSEAELQATQAQVHADLFAMGAFWGGSIGGCYDSDTVRVQIRLYNGTDTQLVERVRAALAPHGDRVRLEVVPHGPPSPGGPLPPAPAPVPAPEPAISVQRYVSMTNPKRCIRGKRVRIALRRGMSDARSLSVKVNGRRRTISGARLRKPLEVRLTRKKTVVEVAVRLRGGRSGTKVFTFTRCR
jgi:hypothetical protein